MTKHKTHKSVIFVSTIPLCVHLYNCFKLSSSICVIVWPYKNILYLLCFYGYQENSHPENSHPSSSSLENSYPENSHPENSHLEYSTHVSKIFPPEFLNFLFFHYCHCHHWYYLKDCFVILCFKSAEVRNSEADVSKKLKLAGPSLIIGHYYNAPVLLDDFAFEASHEECDVKKCNQRNGAG